MLPQEKADYIYNSNALDGITLNSEQTLWIVNGQINSLEVEEIEAPDGETYETAVVASHLDALNFVLGYPKTRPLAEGVVKEIHVKCMHDVLVAPGEYREHNPKVPMSFQVDHTEVPDLMKLLGLDSGLQARKELAQELGYTGDTGDSAAMNMWLHKQVMQKLAQNGGKVPDELRA